MRRSVIGPGSQGVSGIVVQNNMDPCGIGVIFQQGVSIPMNSQLFFRSPSIIKGQAH